MWAAPLALWCLFHVRIQANHVIGSWTGVTQNDLSSLLAHLTVVLMICFISIPILCLHWEKKKEMRPLFPGHGFYHASQHCFIILSYLFINYLLSRPFFFFLELLGFFFGRLLRLEPSDTEKLPSSKSLSTSGSSSSL